ncbi:MAG TPA: hypothetical protein GX532_04050 [Clostridia bacterium]|nr:hypothetical protein [Clostridia bacterium]
MKKKSKFMAFILSFLPGLSHVYVGFKERAVIFFGVFLGMIFGAIGMSTLTGNEDFLVLLVLALPLIWFVSMVDAISLTERSGLGENNGSEQAGLVDEAWFNLNNKKLITVILSIVPGAGHMYLGLQNRGFVLMGLFFFFTCLMGWLHLSLFLFILPVIWFYSMFDAFHRVQDEEGSVEKDELHLVTWCQEHPQWIGWGLILLGCLVVFERIISPFITWQIRNYVQTGLVALLLIAGGLKLLVGSKSVSVDEESEEISAEEMEMNAKEEQDV